MTEFNETPDLATDDAEDTEGHIRVREDADDADDIAGRHIRAYRDDADDTEGHFRR